MGRYLVGIDHGTGGAKACIIDEAGEVLSYAYREYPILVNRPGWSEHDPHLYWQTTRDVIQACLTDSGVAPSQIAGIANSSALPSLVMVDGGGQPVHLAYNLMDRRAVDQVRWLLDNLGAKRLFAVTCNRLEDHPLLVNLMWERQNRRSDYTRVSKALTIDGYIRLKLTGKATANYSSGAFFGVAYDIRNNRFDETIMDEIGIPMELMPEFFPCEEIVGYVTECAAAETGLRPGIPVAAGSVDCNAGWVGGGAIAPGDIQINLGTCGVLGVVHEDRGYMLDTMINCSYPTDSRNVFVSIAATTCGGQCLRYLRDEFCQLEMAAEKLVPGFNVFESQERQAEAVPLGSDGLLVLPYLMGERTPLWDVNARSVVFGLSLHHTKGHLIRAMMEGVAYAMCDSFLIVKGSCPRINLPIVMNEGGAKNRLWRRIITDVFNVPTVLLESRIGAPFGDAILAGVATGVFKDFSIARQRSTYVDAMEPILENHRRYMEYYDLFGRLYQHVKCDFESLAKLRNQHEPG